MTNSTTTKAPAAGTTKFEKLLLASGPLDATAHAIFIATKHSFEHEIGLLEDKKKEELNALLKLENFSHYRHGDHYDPLAWMSKRIKIELLIEELDKDLKIIKALYDDYFGTATTTTTTTAAASTSSSTTEPATLMFNASLDGAHQNPPVATNAHGTATFMFNNVTKVGVLTLNYSGVSPISAHIHKGAVGVNGAIVFPLDITMNPIVYTTPPLTTEQEADLKAGLYYVNIHSAAYPDGEIRGQLVK